MAVMDSVYTLYKNGFDEFPLAWILIVITGNPSSTLTAKNSAAIVASINKLRTIQITVDCSREYTERYMNKVKRSGNNNEEPSIVGKTFKSTLVPLEETDLQFSSNSKITKGYKMTGISALYQYGELQAQIANVPAELMHTKGFSDTECSILVKRYIISRVASIVKVNSVKSNKISFAWKDKNGGIRGMYASLGFLPDKSPAWRKEKRLLTMIQPATHVGRGIPS